MNYLKKSLTIYYRLRGRADENEKYLPACLAYDEAKKHHTGTRKDDITPEFAHQLDIVGRLLLFKKSSFINPVSTIVVAFLHDTSEDYDVSKEEIEKKFGPEIARKVELITKKFRGNKKNIELYYKEMASDPDVSLVKGLDRLVNLMTMTNKKKDGSFVFGIEKQKQYIEETEKLVLPMLKEARKNFPYQNELYLQISNDIKSVIEGLKILHEVIDKNDRKM